MPWQPVLGLAGFNVALDLPSHCWWESLVDRLGHFAVNETPDAFLCVQITAPMPETDDREPRVFQDARGLHLKHDQYFGTVCHPDEAVLQVATAPNTLPDATFPMAVDGLLRLLLAQLLQRTGSLMLHAAGLIGPQRKGYIFFGPSGSGKTTMCKLSDPQFPVLCDELIAIRLDREVPTLYSTPFAGAWGKSFPGHCALAGLYRLRHAPQTQVEDLSPSRAIREILESMVYYDQSPTGLSQSLEIAAHLAQAVPVRELAFLPEAAVWQTIAHQNQPAIG